MRIGSSSVAGPHHGLELGSSRWAPHSPEVIVYDLEAGDCLADPLSRVEGTRQTVPCSKPHSEEIYATPTLPEGDFPGQDAIFEQAEELCITEFESFIGLPYEESALDIDISTPSERTWRVGDRLVICAIFDPKATRPERLPTPTAETPTCGKRPLHSPLA